MGHRIQKRPESDSNPEPEPERLGWGRQGWWSHQWIPVCDACRHRRQRSRLRLVPQRRPRRRQDTAGTATASAATAAAAAATAGRARRRWPWWGARSFLEGGGAQRPWARAPSVAPHMLRTRPGGAQRLHRGRVLRGTPVAAAADGAQWCSGGPAGPAVAQWHSSHRTEVAGTPESAAAAVAGRAAPSGCDVVPVCRRRCLRLPFPAAADRLPTVRPFPAAARVCPTAATWAVSADAIKRHRGGIWAPGWRDGCPSRTATAICLAIQIAAASANVRICLWSSFPAHSCRAGTIRATDGRRVWRRLSRPSWSPGTLPFRGCFRQWSHGWAVWWRVWVSQRCQ
mmetsp:Transcript_20754/g.62518  ORF Transcript_20754/g.62518 Transcript_20754/m.62518 type:complete len:341 (-) Transcript_20754:2473-3495(-)